MLTSRDFSSAPLFDPNNGITIAEPPGTTAGIIESFLHRTLETIDELFKNFPNRNMKEIWQIKALGTSGFSRLRSGYWAGACSVLFDSENSEWFLYYRTRGMLPV
jgi:hypothetical protein